MIVLKAPQGKILAALQMVAGIVDRRHSLPVLGSVSSTPVPSAPRASCHLETSTPSFAHTIPARQGWKPHRIVGFFSVMKVNLRNAP